MVRRWKEYEDAITPMGNTDSDVRQENSGGADGAENDRPPLGTYEELAKMIDLALLAPDFTEDDVARGCDLAKSYGIRSVTLRPADVQLASQWLSGSGVIAGAAVSY